MIFCCCSTLHTIEDRFVNYETYTYIYIGLTVIILFLVDNKFVFLVQLIDHYHKAF